jgi:hypothetical protein
MSKMNERLARCAHNGHAVLDTASPNSMGIAGQARNDAGVGL